MKKETESEPTIVINVGDVSGKSVPITFSGALPGMMRNLTVKAGSRTDQSDMQQLIDQTESSLDEPS